MRTYAVMGCVGALLFAAGCARAGEAVSGPGSVLASASDEPVGEAASSTGRGVDSPRGAGRVADAAASARQVGQPTSEGASTKGRGGAVGENEAAGAGHPVDPNPDESSDQAGSVTEISALDGSASTSVGSCEDGRLEGGVALPRNGPGFMHNPRRPDQARFATIETVQSIIRAATRVAEKWPGSTLVVNDLCLQQGGPIRQHGSHQNGRDADILFYYLDAKGKPIPSVGVPVDPRGWGWDFKDLAVAQDDVRLRIDVRRTWHFMHALLDASGTLLQRIFIAEHIRSMLLAEAERARAPRKVRDRFGNLTCQPSTPHDDHMHVRFFCTAEDILAGCLDKYPMYPWRLSELRAKNVKPVMARAKPGARKRARRRTVSPAQARRRAGRMHWRVRKFLDQREAWLPKPSPGRTWCR